MAMTAVILRKACDSVHDDASPEYAVELLNLSIASASCLRVCSLLRDMT